MYSPTHIANFFLSREDSTQEYPKCPIDNYKLNKLVYIAYGYSLAILNEEIFEESVEAWKYGPVIPSLYHEFKRFGGEPIINQLAIHYSESKSQQSSPEVDKEDKNVLNILLPVYQKYAHWDRDELNKVTHHKDSPWEDVYIENKQCTKIDNDKIKAHFQTILPLETPSKALQEKLDQVCNDIKSDKDKSYPIFNMADLAQQT